MLVTHEEQIKSNALALGFDLVGIASAGPPAGFALFERWLAEGRHGEMSYLARNVERRADPQRLLPGAKSVVVVACNYHASDAAPGPRQGRVARYALGDDYHEIIGKKLAALIEAIRVLAPGAQAKACVDTAPVLEREMAQRAGLGWIGKNTMLLNRRFGQWLFLGEILLDVALRPDAPETRDRCGRCTRCIAACPTRAIVAPRELDARRCISYLTIELKGPIPPSLRPLIGNRIFGCDDCLEVCPWNRFAQQARAPGFSPRADLTTPELLDLLELDEEEFQRRFARSPILRAKRRGLLRNVCVALGNARDSRAIPALTRALEDAEPLVREHAAWALERIGS
ncbi:MAG: tRNA epoxyqueuosine(34) reductase QueG [Verrucomicrobia bacterium GWF2_62_7]|nr:MAG: tRNA epoxyqueuosine(34) reductase QueG [Verrucomicrobia bacterium GWF2_62_7]